MKLDHHESRAYKPLRLEHGVVLECVHREQFRIGRKLFGKDTIKV
jgi:hypothetical protein